MMISLRRKTAWNTKPSPSCSGTRAAHKQCRSVYIAFYCGCCPLFVSPHSNALSWDVPPGPNTSIGEHKSLTPIGETFEHEQQHGGNTHHIQLGETRALTGKTQHLFVAYTQIFLISQENSLTLPSSRVNYVVRKEHGWRNRVRWSTESVFN